MTSSLKVLKIANEVYSSEGLDEFTEESNSSEELPRFPNFLSFEFWPLEPKLLLKVNSVCLLFRFVIFSLVRDDCSFAVFSNYLNSYSFVVDSNILLD